MMLPPPVLNPIGGPAFAAKEMNRNKVRIVVIPASWKLYLLFTVLISQRRKFPTVLWDTLKNWSVRAFP